MNDDHGPKYDIEGARRLLRTAAAGRIPAGRSEEYREALARVIAETIVLVNEYDTGATWNATEPRVHVVVNSRNSVLVVVGYDGIRVFPAGDAHAEAGARHFASGDARADLTKSIRVPLVYDYAEQRMYGPQIEGREQGVYESPVETLLGVVLDALKLPRGPA